MILNPFPFRFRFNEWLFMVFFLPFFWVNYSGSNSVLHNTNTINLSKSTQLSYIIHSRICRSFMKNKKIFNETIFILRDLLMNWTTLRAIDSCIALTFINNMLLPILFTDYFHTLIRRFCFIAMCHCWIKSKLYPFSFPSYLSFFYNY